MAEEKVSSDSLYDERGFLHPTEEEKKYDYSLTDLSFMQMWDRLSAVGHSPHVCCVQAMKFCARRKERLGREKNNLKKD